MQKNLLDSKVVECDGVFVGVAIQSEDVHARRFYATHDAARALHEVTMPDLATLELEAGRLFRRYRAEAGR